MYSIEVETEFAAAHYLKDYNGKCENLHGHNYKVKAIVKGNTLDCGGMLFDFAKLKAALRLVSNTLDHTNLNDLKDQNNNLIFSNNPSAERIALYIYNALLSNLKTQGIDLTFCKTCQTPCTSQTKSYISEVCVYETPTSKASYSVE